jgi:Alpha/beta hydrolase
VAAPVLTVDALRRADPGRLADAGTGWRRLADTLADQTADLDRRLSTLRTGWTGGAAQAATGLVGSLCDELDAVHPRLVGIERAVTDHSVAVARAQALAFQAPEDALVLAADSDVATAARLRPLAAPPTAPLAALTTAPLAALPTAPPVPGVPPGAGPAGVAAWWRGLSPAQREWLIEDRPEMIGNLDGIPADARDLANRARLARLLTDPAAPHRAALLGIRARLDPPGPVRPYLLALSTDGRGRAVVALGDPDTADHVVTYVPGVGGSLDGAAGEIARAGQLSAAAGRAAPGRRTSVIAWVGYDAPASVPEAAHLDDARHAAGALHGFQAGLRATHLGAGHFTVLGLSYGSTVVGVTGHGPGLLADDAILIGSPGVGVAHAADLGLDPAHVWASTAKHDVINAAASPHSLLRPDLFPLLRPLVGEHTDQLWFGPSPAGHTFGGHVFSSAPGSPFDPVHAHVAYFDSGNPALADMADIAVGDYAEVR